MLRTALATFSAIVLLIGCSAVPSEEEMKAATRDFKLPHTAPTGAASVYILRPSSSYIGEPIFVGLRDERRKGALIYGQSYFWTSAKPGPLRVCMGGSNPEAAGYCVQIIAQEGQDHFIEVSVFGAKNSKQRALVALGKNEGAFLLKSIDPRRRAK
jgi:hypothetical protein